MAHVPVTIAGRTYRMACEDGDEDHLINLGAQLENKITQLRKAFGEIGDQRLTVMAAMSFVDDLAEAHNSIMHLQDEVDHLKDTLAQATQTHQELQRTIALTLQDTATRIAHVTERVIAQKYTNHHNT
jgi:cell division protein ZapA